MATNRRWRRCQRALCSSLRAIGVVALLGATATAQDIAANERLIEQPPYDTLILKDPPQAFRVQPLSLKPRRPITEIAPERVFEVRLLRRPDRRYRILGEAIEKVILFEQRVLDEASTFAANGEFDKAYENLRFLEEFSPGFPGVKEAFAATLLAESRQHQSRGELERAWLVLLELTKRSPETSGASDVMFEVARELMKGELSRGDDRAARARYDVFSSRYPRHPGNAVLADLLQQAAESALQLSHDAAQGGDWATALSAVRRTRRLWPETAGADEFYRELQRDHPVVMVAVRSLTGGSAIHRGNWDAVRDSFLGSPLLLYPQMADGTLAGWASAVGKLADRTDAVAVQIPSSASAAAVNEARQWCMTHLTQRLPWQPSAKMNLRVDGGSWEFSSPAGIELVRAILRREFPLARAYDPEPGEDMVVWTYRDAWRGARGRAPYQIIARQVPEPDELIVSWQRGDLAAVDRLWPWELARWRHQPDATVAKYSATTTHLLIVNPYSKPLVDPYARRALRAAINRQRILDEQFRGGDALWPLALPFPRNSLSNRPPVPRYQPELWAALWAPQLDTEATEKRAPRARLRLVRGTSPLAVRACEAIKAQLELGGLGPQVSVLPMVDGQPPGNWDLLYIEWYGMEPVTDVWPMMAQGGLLQQPPFEVQRILDEWERQGPQERAGAVQELAQVLHANPIIIGLWENEEFFVRQSHLQGLAPPALSLFERVGEWHDAEEND